MGEARPGYLSSFLQTPSVSFAPFCAVHIAVDQRMEKATFQQQQFLGLIRVTILHIRQRQESRTGTAIPTAPQLFGTEPSGTVIFSV